MTRLATIGQIAMPVRDLAIARLPDHELWMAFFDDGEGNTLALMHEKR